ncbi:MAG: IS21 family transposase [Nitrososphaera sp.]|nr:IS21 family transposase [Nitrososphaera sp.]
MRTIKEILRLWFVLCLPYRKIEISTGASRGTVAEYIIKARDLGLTWEQIEPLSESELERRLLSGDAQAEKQFIKPMPNWADIDQELRSNKSVTLVLLHQEYKERHTEGYSYSQFHFHFSEWKKKQGIVMRQLHRAGEKLFVDYCDGPQIVLASGQTVKTHIFVAVWGASNYTFAQASLSQDLANWTKSHVLAFEYFGSVPHILVPDNLRSAVSRPCRYEPDLNPTYHELAVHYGTAIIPARPGRPRDKAKVEAGVLLVQRWILAVLRKRVFSNVAELNEARSRPRFPVKRKTGACSSGHLLTVKQP